MPSTPPSLKLENPPSPYSHGPPPNNQDRGTPRNRKLNMAGKDQARNVKVKITQKEASAAAFAAAALTHIFENPDMYSSDWTTGAKTHKDAILALARKVSQTAEGANEPDSPAEVIRRLQLNTGTAAPSRKRQFGDLSGGDDNRVYKEAPNFTLDNSPASPAKKLAEAAPTDKANAAAIATPLENKEYFKDVATFTSKFG